MPNSRINPSLATALQTKFGGTPQASVPQQQPAPTPSGAPGAGPSLWEAIRGVIGPTGTSVFDKSVQDRTNGRK